MASTKKVKIKSSPRQNYMDKSNKKSLESVNEIQNKKIYFTFQEFKFESINIENFFNNHYKNPNHCLEKISILLQALPMFSNETINDLIGDRKKKSKFHFHPLEDEYKDKYEDIKIILKEYKYPEKRIDDIILGRNLFQFALQTQRSSTRLIVERFDNIFSVLFVDVNHHMYLNEAKTEEKGSFNFEYCPNYKNDDCDYMKQMDNCYAFEYLDKQKILETLGYNYKIEEAE